MRFLDIFVRQNHPGELRHHYADYGEKLAGAREYRRLEDLPWPLLVDDHQGSVHRAYGGEQADPTILLDRDGRVALYQLWTHVPTLERAIRALLAQGGRGTVLGGVDRRPHLLASVVDGYRGPRRGGRRGVAEYNRGGFGAGTLSYLGGLAKPLLAPIALRSRPLSDVRR
ncbi:MAG: hypothetical protein L0H64_17945 [Pseudonocardia sp.]|nr:hypothetical protein [Pseudonocardia sp.]